MAFWSWPESPEGELWSEMSDTLEVLLKDVGLDARERKFLVIAHPACGAVTQR